MSLREILVYCLRSGLFALVVSAVYVLLCCIRGRKPGLKRLLGVFYLAALMQITVVRGGVNWKNVFSGSRQLPQLAPLHTVALLVQMGDPWKLIYNVVGNLAWFVPLGMLLGSRRWMWPLGLGALVSLSIELLQYLLMTGMTDIDDLLLNALGAWIGWMLMQIYKKNRCAS